MSTSWASASQLGHSGTIALGDKVQDCPPQASLKALGSSPALPLPRELPKMAAEISKQTSPPGPAFLGLVHLALASDSWARLPSPPPAATQFTESCRGHRMVETSEEKFSMTIQSMSNCKALCLIPVQKLGRFGMH